MGGALLALLPGLATQSLTAQVVGGDETMRAVTVPDEARASSECCLVLLLPVGARAVAVGRTLGAWPSPDAVFTNPAGLAGLEGDHFVLHHSTTVAGQANTFSLLLSPDLIGTVGISYQLLDHGDIETTDDTGITTGTLTIRDHLLVASFATPLAAGISVGLNYKLYQFRIDCRGFCSDHALAATTHGMDAGLVYRSVWPRSLLLSTAVTNLGFPLQVVNAAQADPLPTRVKLGATYEVMQHMSTDSTVALWVAAELSDRWHHPGNPAASMGMELIAGDAIYLRAGYTHGEGLETGFAVGVGYRSPRFSIGVGKSFAANVLDPESEPIQVSLGLRF